MNKLLLICIILVLSACGQELSGTYSNDGFIDLKFKPNNKVSIVSTMMDMNNEMEMDYIIKGNEIKISTPQGIQVLTINDNGSLTGMGEQKPFVKK